MYVELQEFLTWWEPLSLPNTAKYVGVTQRTMGQLFRSYYHLDVGDNELFSQLGRLIKREFDMKFKEWTYVDTGKRMKYCGLQPKDRSLWIYLHEFPVGYGVFSRTKSKSEGDVIANDSRPSEICNKVCQAPCTCSVEHSINLKSGNLGDRDDLEFSDDDNDGARVASNIEDGVDSSTEEDGEEDALLYASKVDKVVKKPRKSLFPLLPALGSSTMKTYAEKQMENAPDWIRRYLQTQKVDSGIDLTEQEPVFITKQIREELDTNGFAVVKQVFGKELLEETLRCIQLKQRAEGIDENSYQNLSGHRYSVGLVTKHGWTKTDYTGLAQQVITASPNLYTCASELYGTSRLLPNFYEYKFNFGRSGSERFYEFIHSDCNYAQLLFAEQLGLPVDKFYQLIVPVTPMSPETTTVYVAKGFHKCWKDATHRSMAMGHWSRRGWKTCDPRKQFLPEDFKNLISDQFVGLRADPGDLIIFSSLLPHGPNVNVTSEMRVALYPFLAPYLAGNQQGRSYLPNGLDSVTASVISGSCPEYSAHPWCNYKLSKLSHQFYSCLPVVQLPRTLLGDCLFGFEPWTKFEKSKLAKHLFSQLSSARQAVVEVEEDRVISALKEWNEEVMTLLESHQRHLVLESSCKLCVRMESATLLEWWHSTDAVYHCLRGCTCYRCKNVQELGWKSWRSSGGCTCYLCKPLVS